LLFNSLNAVQIAYHVPDPEKAAHEYARSLGWGPFFLFEHIPLANCRYRGVTATFDHSSAYGQAGDIMIELITQHDDTPSVLRDLYARDQIGIHHVAHFVPNLGESLSQALADGGDIALDACTSTGTHFAMLDMTRQLGHMIELYEGAGDLLKFYRYVRRAADGWNGSDPLRRLKF
jgi:catechol 2,3-dioxygenase-like lactoylglutathione lyase family enzyme